jgi:hydroxymethylpyrimidine/phosphomethylpyrimidine kinase
MQFHRPIVMSVAGLDPCGGAGLLADIKAFEQHKVYGLGITTAQTLQTESAFVSIRWERDDIIVQSIEHLLAHYDVRAVKIGIVQSINTLSKIVAAIHAFDENIKIVVEPVIRSSTEFDFWQSSMDESLLCEVLEKIELITPNYKETVQLVADADAKTAAKSLSRYCNVLLKGGHNDEEQGVDYLYTEGHLEKLMPDVVTVYPKHGSGCVLSDRKSDV